MPAGPIASVARPTIHQPSLPILRHGSRGKAVVTLQQRLTAAGFSTRGVDGTFGNHTRDAVKAFQRARGLGADGVVGPRTWAKLDPAPAQSASRKVKSPSELRAAEKWLLKLGYDPGEVDGKFDPRMAKAVKAFRSDQGLPKNDDAFLSHQSLEALSRESRALDHAPYRDRITQDVPARRALDQRTAAAAATERPSLAVDWDTGPVVEDDAAGPLQVGIGRGDVGAVVKHLQERLRAAGFDPKREDGVFDQRTEAALRVFQKRAGVKAGGRVDPQTWRALSPAHHYATGPATPYQWLGERSAEVLKSEQLLAQLGFDPGKVDGRFDEATLAASMRFEQLYPGHGKTGKIDPKQLGKMEQLAGQSSVSLDQLRKIMPRLPEAKARQYLPHLNQAMAQAKLDTGPRKAMFLAQLAHESVELKYFEEIASGAAYEGRRSLGNVQPGDGRRYKAGVRSSSPAAPTTARPGGRWGFRWSRTPAWWPPRRWGSESPPGSGPAAT